MQTKKRDAKCDRVRVVLIHKRTHKYYIHRNVCGAAWNVYDCININMCIPSLSSPSNAQQKGGKKRTEFNPLIPK